MFIDFTNADFENGQNFNKLNWTELIPYLSH